MISKAAQRGTEQKSALVICRIFIATLFLAILIGYIFVQIDDVRLDIPIFSVNMQDIIEEEEIPMPIKTNISPKDCGTHYNNDGTYKKYLKQMD
ncbi:hypothetical protein GLOIN_2v1675431 [Rhizophagus clarus]|uniref:Uncharacterized protein n=1 Tax=Rhizophagus clarus TaxID=94130 RepID=A0A8H3QJ98_9GLOM|nr:hypothetical protein GLOIN_2v1675431 [Rhizophagus clarus]